LTGTGDRHTQLDSPVVDLDRACSSFRPSTMDDDKRPEFFRGCGADQEGLREAARGLTSGIRQVAEASVYSHAHNCPDGVPLMRVPQRWLVAGGRVGRRRGRIAGPVVWLGQAVRPVVA